MKIAILGYGKMGKTIEGILAESGQHEVVLKINRANLEELTVANLKLADVAIEFSRPEAALKNIELCFEAGVPVVSGTTGWLEHYEAVCAQCVAQQQALVYASNFSVGVNIFFAINKQLATLMAKHPHYRVHLEEIHHLQKLDAPSGTGISLANQILAERADLQKWVNRAVESAGELAILSHREEDVKGTHEVVYESPIDRIEIKHVAHSRAGFAQGAIMAAEWIVGKTGVFTMADVLGMTA